MNDRTVQIYLAFALALLSALALVPTVHADDHQPVATRLTIEPLDPASSGTPVTIRVRLQTLNDERLGALDNETIDLSIDGIQQRRAKTDPSGIASFSLPGTLAPGTYTITATYAGSQALRPSSATATLSIVPAARTPAQPLNNVPTVLTIAAIGPLPVGATGTVAVQLRTLTGENAGAVGNEVMQLFIDDAPVRRDRTDPTGAVSFRIPNNLPIGTHTLRVEYPGTRALLPTSASTELSVIPAVVEIRIVPALAGVRFTLNQREFVSDAAGVARIEVDRTGTYPLEILPIAPDQAGVRIEFSRWLDEVFTPHREVDVPLAQPLYLGFNVYRRVSQRFIDLERKPVDLGRITTVILKSSQGMAFKLTDYGSRWMQASAIARRTTGLEETKIQYSVDRVIVDGSNVVNQSQQRFYVQPNDEWVIQLLLYSARFRARDGLFMFPLGSGIHLEHPDGHVEEVPFDSNAEVAIRSLVRGIYRVKVSGAPGIAPLTPVALSRNQDVQLLVISYLDLAVVAGLASALGFGLLFLGRPRLFFMLGKPLAFAFALAGAQRSPLNWRLPWREAEITPIARRIATRRAMAWAQPAIQRSASVAELAAYGAGSRLRAMITRDLPAVVRSIAHLLHQRSQTVRQSLPVAIRRRPYAIVALLIVLAGTLSVSPRTDRTGSSSSEPSPTTAGASLSLGQASYANESLATEHPERAALERSGPYLCSLYNLCGKRNLVGIIGAIAQ